MVERESVLQNLDFGDFVAENEDNLTDIFVLTEKIKNNIFTPSPPEVILGPKGSGKSAVFKLFSDHEEYIRDNFQEMFKENNNKILISNGSGQEDELRKGLTRVDSDVDNFDPEEYWRLYFVIKVALYLNNNDHELEGDLYELLQVIDEGKSWRLASLVNKFYKKVVGPTPDNLSTPLGDLPLEWNDINTTGLLDEEEKYLRENDITIWILIDRIDQIGNDRDEMKRYVEGLFSAQIYLQDYKGIEPKIFVRSDIWEELNIINRDYLEQIDLSWDERELITLINKRMMETELVRKYVSKNMARDLDLTNIGEYKKQTQKEIFNTIFVKKIGGGQTGSPTSRWMRRRVTNGKGNKYPREMINFCRTAKRIQENKNKLPAKGIIGEDSLKEALKRISKKHVENVLYSEYEEFNPHFDKIRGGEKQYSRSELIDMFNELSPSGDEAIKRLYHIGLLNPLDHGEYTSDNFEIPKIHRNGLRIVTKGRK